MPEKKREYTLDGEWSVFAGNGELVHLKVIEGTVLYIQDLAPSKDAVGVKLFAGGRVIALNGPFCLRAKDDSARIEVYEASISMEWV